MARKKGRGTELNVFKGREAKLNRAIFQILATEGPLTIKNLQRHVSKFTGFRGTYYASVSKRIRCLEEIGYVIKIAQPIPYKVSQAVAYKLSIRAYLVTLLDSHSIEELLNQMTDSAASLILMALLKSLPKENQISRFPRCLIP